MRFLSFLLFTVLFLTSCYDKNYGVEFDDQLVPYFERFKEDAAKRGVVFDNEKEKIEGYIQVITTEGGIAGLCNPDTDRNRSVIIDARVWNTADELTKEYIVYHELGHCFLKRPHIEDDPTRRDTTKSCASMMFSGTYQPNCLDLYSNADKQALLDELFKR